MSFPEPSAVKSKEHRKGEWLWLIKTPDKLYNCHAEDDSRLVRAPDATPWLRTIYEPLVELVTDEWLRPYCCLLRSVYFYQWFATPADVVLRTEHVWTNEDVVESAGERWQLGSATCVYHLGQWCMRWSARRTDKALRISCEPGRAA